jgi:hypothetical protein
LKIPSCLPKLKKVYIKTGKKLIFMTVIAGKINLLLSTCNRRYNEVTDTAQLTTFIHGIRSAARVPEKLASLRTLYHTMTDEDLFMEVKKHLLPWNWTGKN